MERNFYIFVEDGQQKILPQSFHGIASLTYGLPISDIRFDLLEFMTVTRLSAIGGLCFVCSWVDVYIIRNEANWENAQQNTHTQAEHRVRVDVNFITVMRNYRNTRKRTRVLKRNECLMAKKFFASTPSPVCFLFFSSFTWERNFLWPFCSVLLLLTLSVFH